MEAKNLWESVIRRFPPIFYEIGSHHCQAAPRGLSYMTDPYFFFTPNNFSEHTSLQPFLIALGAFFLRCPHGKDTIPRLSEEQIAIQLGI